MKKLQAKRSICLMFALLALAAVGHFGVSVAGAEAPAAASAESMARNTASAGAQPIGVDASPLTITVQTPSGGMSRLTYVNEEGWRLDDQDALLKPNEARIKTASAEQQKESSAAEQPMTVFIDDPTGIHLRVGA
jgi:hypothetical protein